tara:strand:- start:254 stop:508 length:255 start_codon:yes stop_codon:yes gene_type:complete
VKITKAQLKQIIKEELEAVMGGGSGRKFEIIKPITVELPGDVRDYQPGDVVTLQGCDKETRDGIGICWGHGGYSWIPVGYYREL